MLTPLAGGINSEVTLTGDTDHPLALSQSRALGGCLPTRVGPGAKPQKLLILVILFLEEHFVAQICFSQFFTVATFSLPRKWVFHSFFHTCR